MRATIRLAVLFATSPAALTAAAHAQLATGAAPAPANRAVYLDDQGVVRWRDDRQEVTLFGANYVLPTASDYRAAGYLHADRKKMIDEDMAQFARMGWDGLRLTFWGDWEASDSAGNLIANDHLDLQDYLIARARERGVYMLFSPIQLYGSNWPDALQDSSAPPPGFGRRFGKARMGTDPAAIAAQVTYLRQILDHVNPYTGVALKDEPAILFIELVNEPWHHPEDLQGSIRYINALTDAVRSTGCAKLVFYNVSQDFRIAEAIARSRAQGVTFGWYPTGLNSGHELDGNYLRTVDTFPDMLRPELARLPRIVYEFDSPDLRTGTMYPAMARTFRAVGAQVALMFAYDMQATASRNLGWQTHYLSLVYTPRKAMSAIIAAEAMHRLPRWRSYGPYPQNTRFGDFHVSYDGDLGELVARDALLYAGSTRATPPDPAALRRIAGYGSSPVVTYDGEGIYFLNKVGPGVWRLEVYPDAVPVRDPFEPPSPDKIVTRAISRAWPMTVALPDLGASFTVQPITAGNPRTERAAAGRFTVTPGVYVLSVAGPVDVATLPPYVGAVGFAEYHAPPADSLPALPSVQSLAAPEYLAGRDADVRARIVDRAPPDSATLFIRPTAGGFYRGYAMRPAGGYEYAASVQAAALREGPYEFVITVFRGGSGVTFPGGLHLKPTDWNYYGRASWTLDVVGPRTPLRLFTPGADAARLAFSRIGDAGRRGLFRLALSGVTGQPVFHFELPVSAGGGGPADYTASLVIKDRIKARRETITGGDQLRVRLRGVGRRQVLHLTLVEDDGTSWTAALTVDSTWSERSLPLTAFTLGRGVLLPQGFPGEWSYWVGPAAGRGASADRPRLDRLERLQLSLRREVGVPVTLGGYGVEVESITMGFGALRGAADTAPAPTSRPASVTALEPMLLGRAILPADAYQPGPPSGAFITGDNGVTPPFPGQPIPGFSAVLDAGSGTFWAMPDNGYGAKGNSADFLLRLYRVRPDFKTARGGSGRVEVLDFIQLRDPDGRIPFGLTRADRLLTGADFDIESVRRARGGDFWFGEEFGPFLLHTDATGKLLEGPYPLPGVQSPQNPLLPDTGAWTLSASRGFEGMALSLDGRTLYPMIEGAVRNDPNPRRRILNEFDLRRRAYTGRTWQYQVDAASPDAVIGDLTALDEHRLMLIERDDFQGAEARQKKIYLVDLRRRDAQGFLEKELVLDLLRIRDPAGVSLPARPDEFGVGDPFSFPLQSVESLWILDAEHLLIANDNNYPFSNGRWIGRNRPDDTELIVVRVPQLR